MSSPNEVTISNMMELLNPTGKSVRKSQLKAYLENELPQKRRLSSESFDSPTKKSKNDFSASFDSSWLASPRETRRIHTELVESRNQITTLEHRIKKMHGVRKELQIMLDNEIQTLQTQRERDQKTIKNLEEQMQDVRKRERDLKEELERVTRATNTTKIEYEKKVDDLELRIAELESQVELYKSGECDEILQMKLRIEELEIMLETSQKDADSHKDLSETLEKRISELMNFERELEIKEHLIQNSKMKIKELEFNLETFSEWQSQAKVYQQKLAKYPDLEREVQRLRDETKHLKDEVQNKLILEEQVYDLNARLDSYREKEKEFSSLQVAHGQLECLVDEWRSVAREVCDSNVSDVGLPRQLRQVIEKLQQNEVAIMSDKVHQESQLKQSQHDLKLSKLEFEKVSKHLSDLQTVQQQQQTIIQRLQKKLMLVSRDRDSYRQQLDSYEKDLTISLPQGIESIVQAQINTQKERIESLEKIIEGYREMITNLEAELNKAQKNIMTDMVPVRTEQLSRLQEQVDRLQNENDQLRERNDELSIRLEQELIGRDSVAGKVLHFKMNPVSESLQDQEANIDKMKETIDKLRRKVRHLEEGIESSKLSESAFAGPEMQQLREQLKTSEVKIMRLKEYFKKASQDFRNACYAILGYRINKVSDTKYKLSSQFAEHPDHCLEFDVFENGDVNLLENEYSAALADMIEMHLPQHGSIPVFLSALTIDLFNRTTMAVME